MVTQKLCSARLCSCFAVFFFIVLAASSVVGRKVNPAQQTKPSGLRAELLLPSSAGVSNMHRHAAEFRRSHSRAQSLGALVSKGGSYESPLSAVPGGYAMNLTIGTPGQTFTAIADTGSDLVWVQSSPCASCFSQPDPLYNPSKSSTFKKLPCSSAYCQDLPRQTCNFTGVTKCPYAYVYGDSSQTDGLLSTDTITLTSTSGTSSTVNNFVFGYGTNNSGTFLEVDGLVGLGNGPLSLTSQLGTEFSSVFSYCLVTFGSQFETPSPIYFGNAAVPSGVVEYTPFVSNPVYPSYYYVNLQSISVAGKKLNIPNTAFAIDSTGKGGLLFDLGTTLTYLVAAAYNPLRTALAAAIIYPSTQSPEPTYFDLCYAPGVESPTFPDITFHFEGADYSLPSGNSFIPLDSFGQTYCLAMTTSDYPLSIFGNVQQANYDIIYDRANSQLGFVSTDCGSTGKA